MIKRLTTLFTSLCLIVTALAQSRNVKDYNLKVGDFTELTVADNVNVVYKFSTDSAGCAVYSCPAEIAPTLTFTNNKGKLKVEVESAVAIPDSSLPTVCLYSSTLTKVTNLSDSTILVATTNPTNKLGLKVMGNGIIQAVDVYVTDISATVEAGSGHIYVSGKAQNAKYNIAGAGVVEGAGLKAQKVKAWVFGTGSIDCSAEKSLTLYGAGSGTVYYIGDPTIKKINVGVKVVKVE